METAIQPYYKAISGCKGTNFFSNYLIYKKQRRARIDDLNKNRLV